MNNLLEKARIDYPIGTKFKSLYGNSENVVTKPIFTQLKNIYTTNDNFEWITIYDKSDNQWAEIIKEEITPLKLLNSKAECIFHISKNGDVILRGKVIANDIELSEILTIINTNTMTQQEFNALRVGETLGEWEILHKFKELLIIEDKRGYDLVDLAKINKLGLKVQPKTFMGLEVKKYDNVPCEINGNQLYYIVEVEENSISLKGSKNDVLPFCFTPTSIRIL